MPTGWRGLISRIDAPRVPLQILEPISLEDVDRLQAACKASSFLDLRDRAGVFFLLGSGVRARELCHLDLGDVNLATGKVKVREGTGGKDRIVYLGPTGLRAVQCYLRKRPNTLSEALFVSKSGDRLSHEGVRQLLERRCSKARLAQTYFPARFPARLRDQHVARRSRPLHSRPPDGPHRHRGAETPPGTDHRRHRGSRSKRLSCRELPVDIAEEREARFNG